MPPCAVAYDLADEPTLLVLDGHEEFSFRALELLHVFRYPDNSPETQRITAWCVTAVRSGDGKWFLGCWANPRDRRNEALDAFHWRQVEGRQVALCLAQVDVDVPPQLVAAIAGNGSACVVSLPGQRILDALGDGPLKGKALSARAKMNVRNMRREAAALKEAGHIESGRYGYRLAR